MKTLILAAILSFTTFAQANSDYDFVRNFEVIGAKVSGKMVTFTISHPETDARAPKFHFSPGNYCLESYPAQCHGTLIRLDQTNLITTVKQTTKVSFDLQKIYRYPKGAIISVTTPTKELTIQY